MELLADRFATTSTGSAIDLATGEAVHFVVTASGGAGVEARWAARCDMLLKLRHRSLAELVDYGALGNGQRFEAWRCGPPWTGSRAEAEAALGLASAFLRLCGLEPGMLSHGGVCQSVRGAVVLPDGSAAYPAEPGAKAEPREKAEPCENDATCSDWLDRCGFAISPRPAVAALAELFETTPGARPRIAALWGPSGSGKSTVVSELARLARLHGFVPVASHLLGQRAFRRLADDVLGGRSLFLIDDESTEGWKALMESSMQSPRGHVMLIAGLNEQAAVDGISLARLPPGVLRSMIRPRDVPAELDDRVRRAAVRADGLPGRFVRLLWPGECRRERPDPAQRGPVAAEQPAQYGPDEPTAGGQAGLVASPWPAPEELTALERRLALGLELVARGRHAPGERALRHAIGGFARRDDWAHAGKGAVALASCLLIRGRAADARRVLDQARHYWHRAGDEPSLIQTATLAGIVWIELGRLDEAESVLTAALAAAKARGRIAAATHASLALARCAFWGGQFAEAQRMLTRLHSPAVAPDVGRHVSGRTAVRVAILESRVAVGLCDLPGAVGRALESGRMAHELDDAVLMASAAHAAAFAHLAVGDLGAVEHDVAACLRAAGRARDPLRRVRARLLLAESARRQGRRAEVTMVLRRLQALAAVRLPPIVAARLALLNDLVETTASPGEIVARHAALTGLRALALFAPLGDRRTAKGSPPEPGVDHVLEILQVCQTAENEGTILTDLCARLRRRLHMAAIGFVARDAGRIVIVASEGRRLEPQIAERTIEAGIAVGPDRREDRIEAAVPVKYGSAVIGALAARWTPGCAQDLSAVRGMLTMAATAAAPVLSAALARRERAIAEAPTELIGTSTALRSVREAIVCGARAPFPVLIEGESGSGKELVARALHRRGGRRDRPFCALNCAALPEDLIEAELFGHARGAFTGAVAERPGVFEEAHGGTLFLDEIGELAPRAQAKILRVIQEGELRRIGENLPRRVDVRIVAATNRDLRVEAAAGRFRVDLLYRLDVIRITVPPLRDRREDIAALADHFWREATSRLGSRAALGAATLAALARYDWPGNVRELQNVLAALAVRSPKRGVVPPAALPSLFGESRAADTCRLDRARRTFEECFIRAALVRTGGHRARAAAELGLTRQGLTKLMARLGIGNDRPVTAGDRPLS